MPGLASRCVLLLSGASAQVADTSLLQTSSSAALALDAPGESCEDWIDLGASLVRSNLGGAGPDLAQSSELRFVGAGRLGASGAAFDLRLRNTSAYYPKIPSLNRVSGGGMARMNLYIGASVKLEGAFVQGGTSDPVAPNSAKLTFCDVDHYRAKQEEQLVFSNVTALYVTEDRPEFSYNLARGNDSTALDHSEEVIPTQVAGRKARRITAADGSKFRVSVTSSMFGEVCDDPVDPNALTNVTCPSSSAESTRTVDQAKRCFMLEFKDTHRFAMLAKIPGAGTSRYFTDRGGWSRNFAMAGTSRYFAAEESRACEAPAEAEAAATNAAADNAEANAKASNEAAAAAEKADEAATNAAANKAEAEAKVSTEAAAATEKAEEKADEGAAEAVDGKAEAEAKANTEAAPAAEKAAEGAAEAAAGNAEAEAKANTEAAAAAETTEEKAAEGAAEAAAGKAEAEAKASAEAAAASKKAEEEAAIYAAEKEAYAAAAGRAQAEAKAAKAEAAARKVEEEEAAIYAAKAAADEAAAKAPPPPARAAELAAAPVDHTPAKHPRKHQGGKLTDVKATGDPHMVNVHGQHFDIVRPGAHTLLQIPRWRSPGSTMLRVDALVTQVGGACADMYFQSLNLTGKWVDAKARAKGGLRYRAGEGVRTRWMNFGGVRLKIVNGHTRQGQEYLNFFAKHLHHSTYQVGGLLGEDDHTAATTPSKACKHVVNI